MVGAGHSLRAEEMRDFTRKDKTTWETLAHVRIILNLILK
jgi:hypothetical protein